MSRLLGFGLRQLFGGARRGQPSVAGLGAALSIIGWLRRRRHGKDLLYVRNLREGETVSIRLVRGRTVVDETEVEG